MTRALPRAHLNNSSHVRFLTENALFDATPSGKGVGQTLGDWLNFRQAIALHGLLENEATTAPSLAHTQRAASISPQALASHVEKTRTQLAASVLYGPPAGSGLARIDMPPPELADPPDLKTAFEPYRKFLSAHQRQMESTVRNLRAQLRLQLSKRNAAGSQLAALDAAFESILSEREAALLAKVNKQLEKRFVKALKAHLQAPEDPARWLSPLHQTFRQTLLAELDTRLQPALGLLEALTSFAEQKQ